MLQNRRRRDGIPPNQRCTRLVFIVFQGRSPRRRRRRRWWLLRLKPCNLPVPPIVPLVPHFRPKKTLNQIQIQIPNQKSTNSVFVPLRNHLFWAFSIFYCIFIFFPLLSLLRRYKLREGVWFGEVQNAAVSWLVGKWFNMGHFSALGVTNILRSLLLHVSPSVVVWRFGF